ncbi:MAG: hypothetical protein LH614_12115, partial [Pyrinomonadaceae bacterium]|nr:hypothetical protein [Pyrinomonadaceae bacterium]
MNYQKLICLNLIYTIWISLFAPLAAAQNRIQKTDRPDDPPEVKGLQFGVREKEPKGEENPKLVHAEAVKLSEREANAIFRRLSPMPTAEFNKSDFQIRADSPPPPKTGK